MRKDINIKGRFFLGDNMASNNAFVDISCAMLIQLRRATIGDAICALETQSSSVLVT